MKWFAVRFSLVTRENNWRIPPLEKSVLIYGKPNIALYVDCQSVQ